MTHHYKAVEKKLSKSLNLFYKALELLEEGVEELTEEEEEEQEEEEDE